MKSKSGKGWIRRNRDFIIATIALVLAVLGTGMDVSDFVDRQFSSRETATSYYAPPRDLTLTQTTYGDSCWQSIASNRIDAYRCSHENFIEDPCFITELFTDKDRVYYCPAAPEYSDEDKILRVPRDGPYAAITPESERQANEYRDPWLVEFEGKVVCRRTTGTVDRAYGRKASLFGCNSDKYQGVTEGRIDGKKHYFSCKYKDASVYADCLASRVVY